MKKICIWKYIPTQNNLINIKCKVSQNPVQNLIYTRLTIDTLEIFLNLTETKDTIYPFYIKVITLNEQLGNISHNCWIVNVFLQVTITLIS